MRLDYEHARFVHTAVRDGCDDASTINHQILSSWRRCLEDFGLTPEDRPRSVIRDKTEISQRQERLQQLLAISRVEMASLYQQIAGSGFAIMLTDEDGVVLHYIGDPMFTVTAVKSGLQVGAVWDEATQGTNGMGTCLFERKPLVVHHNEHFLSCNTILTCSAAPILDPNGKVIAALDASSESKKAQQHTVALVSMSAQSIANRLFLSTFKGHFIARFHSRPEFVSTLGEGLIAFNDCGNILSANRSALIQIGDEKTEDIVGKSIEEVFDQRTGNLISRSRAQPYHPLPVRMRKDGRRFFAAVQPCEDLSQLTRSVGAVSGAVGVKARGLRLEDLDLGDPLMARNIDRARRVMDKDIPLLLTGETGTGKDLFAKAFHNTSRHAAKSFVAINCAAIPESLIESELFGYRAGAFTGASRQGSPGKIAQANGGTLFLDEIGDMPLHLQSRLLRVLEEQEVVPLGGEKSVKVSFQLVTATNRDLQGLIRNGEFRQDLYYRLNGITLDLPPLRQRTDFRRLVRLLLSWDFPGCAIGVAQQVVEILEQFDWPGNIRQLRNVLRTAISLSASNELSVDDLPAEIVSEKVVSATAQEKSPLFKMERNTILAALNDAHWNVTKAAKQLNVSRNTLYRKMKRHGITPPR